MTCPFLKPTREIWLDAMEGELSSLLSLNEWLVLATSWWSDEQEAGRGYHKSSLDAASTNRWPILSAWRWCVSMPDREALYAEEPQGHSSHGVSLEGACDLAYRGIVPRALGKALDAHDMVVGAAPPVHSDSDGEEYATLAQPEQVEQEVMKITARQKRCCNAIRVTTVLLLGLRKMRAEYAQMISAWCELQKLASSLSTPVAAPVPPAGNAPHPQAAPAIPRAILLSSILQEWLTSQEGLSVIESLRWLAPGPSTLVARVRSEMGIPTGASSQQVLRACEPLGIPVRTAEVISWGSGLPAWSDAREEWQIPCACAGAPHGQTIHRCSTCGGAVAGQSCAPAVRSLCRWCGTAANLVCSSCLRGIHFRGECCRWNCGAAPQFAPSASQSRALCPDCMWEWVRALASSASPSPAALVALDIRAQMERSASNMAAGAGAAIARNRVPSFTASQARTWFLQHLRERGWVRIRQLHSAALSAIGAGGASSSAIELTALRTALRSLVTEGTLSRNGTGANVAVSLSNGPRRVHQPRQRRRRHQSASHDTQRSVRRRTSSVDSL